MDAVDALGQRPLERAQRAKRLAIRRINLRFGQRAPGCGVGIGLDLLRDVLIQAGIGQQPRFGQMRAVRRKCIDQLRRREGLELIELRARTAGCVAPKAASR